MPKENLPLELLDKHRESLQIADSLVIEGENQLFETYPSPVESAVVFLPKSKPLIDMTLALVSKIVKQDGQVILAGTKKGGIESAKKFYEANVGPVDQKIVGNHSALYVGKNKRLGAGKSVADFISYSPLSYKTVQIEVTNVPGVFSAGELDEGTKLLLDHIPHEKKKVLDVGCGAGMIGAIYKKISPQSDVTMTDTSKLAVLATRKTLEKNGLMAQVLESDVFSNVQGTFDLILTNPPFHTGIETDYSFIQKFAEGAKAHLAPKGIVYVVANSFLAYKNILERHIGPTEIVVDNKKFRVFKATAR